MDGLSKLQRSILVYLYFGEGNGRAEWAEAKAEAEATGEPSPRRWPGVPWTSKVRCGMPVDAADRAAHSRALVRLEARGLVVRLGRIPDPKSTRTPKTSRRRTTHARLTPAGKVVAKRLTKSVG